MEFKTELSELPSLAQKWEALNGCQSDHDAPFFQSYAWNYHVARVRSNGSQRDYRLLVATIWRGADLIGLWPLSLQQRLGARMARSLDDPFGQFAGVLFQEASDVAPGVAAVLDALRSRADGMRIGAVVAGSPLHEALLRRGARTTPAQEAVFVDLRSYPSIKDFRRSVNSKTRKNLRNLGNRLQRAHQTEHIVAEVPARLESILRETFGARVQWMHRNGRTSPAFRDDDFRTLVTGLTQAEGIRLLGFSLATKDASISAQWGFVYAGRYYAYISAMDPSYDKYSPGRMHLAMVIEACFDRGIEVVELMPPASRYKLEWSDRTKKLETMTIPFSVRGRLIFEIAGWAAPTARSLSRALPEFLRRRLVRRLNRG